MAMPTRVIAAPIHSWGRTVNRNVAGSRAAWYLAEKGYKVCLLTPDPYVARELTRTSADIPLREKLTKLGVEFITDSVLLEWRGDAAVIKSFLSGVESLRQFDSLVLACVNTPEKTLQQELTGEGLPIHSIGDCVSPRQAPAAIYEGRRVALAI